MDKIKNKVVLSDTELNALEAIQQEAVAGKLSGYTHTFDTPFTFEGRTYDTLTFDFSKLSGDDDIAIENELQALGKPVVVAEMSGEYQIRLAARACKERLGVDAFTAMPLPMSMYASSPHRPFSSMRLRSFSTRRRDTSAARAR